MASRTVCVTHDLIRNLSTHMETLIAGLEDDCPSYPILVPGIPETDTDIDSNHESRSPNDEDPLSDPLNIDTDANLLPSPNKRRRKQTFFNTLNDQDVTTKMKLETVESRCAAQAASVKLTPKSRSKVACSASMTNYVKYSREISGNIEDKTISTDKIYIGQGQSKIIEVIPCEICGIWIRTSTGGLMIHMRSSHPTGLTPNPGGSTDNMQEKNSEPQQNKTRKLRRKYICTVCKRRFTSRELLLSHQESHFEEQVEFNNSEEFECNKCDRKFRQFSRLLNHSKAHENKIIKVSACQICGLAVREFGFAAHMRLSHGITSGQGQNSGRISGESAKPRQSRYNKCTVCMLNCGSQRELLLHQETHWAKKKKNDDLLIYSCSQCGKMFYDDISLKNHICGKAKGRRPKLRKLRSAAKAPATNEVLESVEPVYLPPVNLETGPEHKNFYDISVLTAKDEDLLFPSIHFRDCQ